MVPMIYAQHVRHDIKRVPFSWTALAAQWPFEFNRNISDGNHSRTAKSRYSSSRASATVLDECFGQLRGRAEQCGHGRIRPQHRARFFARLYFFS